MNIFKCKHPQPVKYCRQDDLDDYPTKPSFIGLTAGYNGKALDSNPYLDNESIKDWLYGYKSGALNRLEHQKLPYLYGFRKKI